MWPYDKWSVNGVLTWAGPKRFVRRRSVKAGPLSQVPPSCRTDLLYGMAPIGGSFTVGGPRTSVGPIQFADPGFSQAMRPAYAQVATNVWNDSGGPPSDGRAARPGSGA